MEDGKRIFRKNAAVKNKFVWERILELLTPNSSNTVVFEGDLGIGETASHDLGDITPTDETLVLLEITGNLVHISSSNVDGPFEGVNPWTVVIGDQAKPIAEFATLIGASDINHFMKVTCPGPGGAHYKIRVTHLA
jgi:hypothetical protein